MPATSYDLNNLPPGIALRLGDRLFIDARRRVLVPLLVDPSAVAEVTSSRVREDLLSRGVRAVISITRVEWVSTFEYEFTLVVAVSGFDDPAQTVLAASAWHWVTAAILAIALVLAEGWSAGETGELLTAGERAPKTLDTISLFPVAAVLIVAFWLIARKA